jgi:type II secretory pathway predicted ATPase ExeA
VALYLEHFGLNEPPFRITPHPDFFFDGADRGATLEGLLYAILHDEGIVKVSGEIGSGKTTLCRVLMERLPQEVETVFLANPSYSRTEILHAIAEELGRAPTNSPPAPALRALQAHLIELYANGRRVVVLIDEAHAMPEDALEQVRLLSNLESSRHKLLQIVLFGQPELDEALAKPSMRQLKDRITHSFRTRPLTEAEVAKYVSFRMRAAGYRGPELFSAAALGAIARASSGLTRRINVLSDKSLLAAFSQGTHAITPRQVRAAIADSDFTPVAGSRPRAAQAAVAALLLVCGAMAGAGIYWFAQHRAPAPAASAQARIVPPPAPPAVPLAPAPAKPKPEKPPAPLLAREQSRRLAGYSAVGNALLRERIAAACEKLESEPDAAYSIELFLTENSDAARMERFLARARDLVPLSQLYMIPVAAGPRYRIRVVYGAFPDRAAAAEAARRLPPKYQSAFQFVPRSFAELRAAI